MDFALFRFREYSCLYRFATNYQYVYQQIKLIVYHIQYFFVDNSNYYTTSITYSNNSSLPPPFYFYHLLSIHTDTTLLFTKPTTASIHPPPIRYTLLSPIMQRNYIHPNRADATKRSPIDYSRDSENRPRNRFRATRRRLATFIKAG